MIDETLNEQIISQIRPFIDIAGIAYVVLDSQGMVELVNKHTCEVLGYLEEEIVAKNWFDIAIAEDEKEKVGEVFSKLMRGETEGVEHFVNQVVAKNGERRTISWHNKIRKDSQGSIVGIISTGEDVTDKMSIEEELEKFKAGLDNSEEIVFITNRDGMIEYINPSFSKVYGYSIEEVEGENPKILKSGKHGRDFYENFWNTLLSGNSIQTEIVNRKKDGSEVVVRASVSPVKKDEEITSFLAVQNDVTLQIEEERRVKEKMDELERLNKLMIGREIQMAEMKKKLKELGV